MTVHEFQKIEYQAPDTEYLRRCFHELERTLEERRHGYERLVAQNRMLKGEADERIALLEGVLDIVRISLASAEEQAGRGPLIAYQGEMWLYDWSETSTRGRRVHFYLPETPDDPEAHPFKRFKRMTGKQAGTIFQAVLVEMDDTGEPVAQQIPHRLATSEELRGGPISQHAGRLCKDPEFLKYLLAYGHVLFDDQTPASEDAAERQKQLEQMAANFVRTVARVDSRRLLDHNRNAQVLYEQEVVAPYLHYLKERQ